MSEQRSFHAVVDIGKSFIGNEKAFSAKLGNSTFKVNDMNPDLYKRLKTRQTKHGVRNSELMALWIEYMPMEYDIPEEYLWLVNEIQEKTGKEKYEIIATAIIDGLKKFVPEIMGPIIAEEKAFLAERENHK